MDFDTCVDCGSPCSMGKAWCEPCRAKAAEAAQKAIDSVREDRKGKSCCDRCWEYKPHAVVGLAVGGMERICDDCVKAEEEEMGLTDNVSEEEVDEVVDAVIGEGK